MTTAYRFPLLARTDVQKSPLELAEEAYQQGFAAGQAAASEQALQQGIQQGRQQAAAEAAARETALRQSLTQDFQLQFDRLAAQFQQRQRYSEQQLQQQLYELICGLSELVLEFELSLNPQQLVHAIHSTLAVINQQDQVSSIQLSAADAERLQQLNITHFADISWQRDERLASGTVQFCAHSQLHLLDFRQRLQEALQQVQQSLLAPLTQDATGITDAS